ncbi:MAG TPA: hypothetical protein PKE57_07445 [Cellvibrionaceae bacterium]|nr:hypothetical protein [Cellvibrionaceae bacterium]HMW70239.1 hypothetical protein [Cellvibrionaceae bacterium]HMY38429.1 hypothetical protein [Marinagarivorans sp.]HNG59515.1 hypothetical protein [Cellvibrionaceae bacterium]
MSLTASQLHSLRQCAEEECSVIEIRQELRGPGEALELAQAKLIAGLTGLAEQGLVEFFLDEFAAAATRPISATEALARLNEPATWDMQNPTQLHVSWVGP